MQSSILARSAKIFSQIVTFILRITICDNSLMVKPWIVIPVIRVRFPVVTPILRVWYKGCASAFQADEDKFKSCYPLQQFKANVCKFEGSHIRPRIHTASTHPVCLALHLLNAGTITSYWKLDIVLSFVRTPHLEKWQSGLLQLT